VKAGSLFRRLGTPIHFWQREKKEKKQAVPMKNSACPPKCGILRERNNNNGGREENYKEKEYFRDKVNGSVDSKGERGKDKQRGKTRRNLPDLL